MKIFANHAHVFPKEFRPDGSIDALLSVMDETGIEEAVCFAPFHNFNACPDPNLWLAGAIRGYPELTGFGVIDMSADDVEAQTESAAKLGFPGLKMHPQAQKFKIDGDKAMRVYKKAEELGLFISFHSGIHWHRIRDAEVLLFDEVAYACPGLRFSMEHVGGYCFFNEAVAVLQNNENAYAGLTSVFDNEHHRLWHLSPAKIADLLHLVGSGRCIFGLDFPYNQAGLIANAIQRVKDLPITEEAVSGILGGNLRKLLKLSAK